MQTEHNEQQDPLSLEQQRDELKKQQDTLQRQINDLNRNKVDAQIEALSESAKKREAEEKEERLVLKELSRKRKEREDEAKAESERIAKEATKQREANEIQLAVLEAAEKAVHEAAEKAKETLQREQEELHRLEQEQLRELAEGYKALVQDDDDDTEIAAQFQEIDSVELARLAARDRATENSKPKVWNPRPKTKNVVDSGASYELETLLRKELNLQVGVMKLDALSAEWEADDLVNATRFVIEAAKGKPCSCDGILNAIEVRLNEAPEAVPDGTA